ncbi:MAG: type II toxin-antitoxin system RelE/ParE family toxin [Clostridium sp.]|nr:type II toxin-antitoxin system RelE/ParE family toxin [Clostridium sp.]MCM1171586.1 type II toxin-antitoxin system RelE/ParE family toxin [Clostridium sp.]MCM1207599.1 type II toxin-antitoxin system RelE/ParE family toxin [Ruminococcus sp.]
MMKLRINPIVAEDLKAIKNFIAEDNVDKALEIMRELYKQFENIQQFPHIGSALSKRVSFKTDYKYIVWNEYIVLYKISKEAVEIYRVVNRYQDITNIFKS